MFDNEAPNIEQITQDLIAQEMPEQPEVHEQEEQPVQQEQVSKNELNIRELRLAKQRAENERDEMARQIASYRNQQQTPPQPQEDYDVNVQPDEIVVGEHYSKLQRKIKNIEDKYSRSMQEQADRYAEIQLRNNFPDIDKVLNRDNIERLRNEHPEIAQSLSSNTDKYSQAAATYKVLTSLGIAQPDNAGGDRARVQANASKPRPLTSLSPQQGNSPLSRANEFANGLTPELSKKLWKETQMAARAS